MQTLTNFWQTTLGKVALLGGAGLMALLSLCCACAAFGAVFSETKQPIREVSRVVAVEATLETVAATATLEPTAILPPPTETPQPTATNTAVVPPTETLTVTPALPTATTAPPVEEQAAVASAEFQEVQVINVVDGDTIDVLIDGVETRVRYILVDTPETKDPSEPVQPFGPEASQANTELVMGKTVRLEKDVSETDQYGRLLRYVYVDDLLVNEELLRRGLAKVATFPPDVKYVDRFLAVQQEAQASGAGLWGSEPVAEPVPATAAPAEPPAEVPPATAGGSVVITTVFFDGAVKQVESDEYVELANQGSEPVDMTGWHINAGDDGQDFYFPQGFVMQPGQSCRAYTNEVHSETCGFSFGSGKAIWNNKGDTGFLYNGQGEVVSQWSY